jgi:uncharacterized protein YjbI with pentapeptide repeats
MDIHFLSRAETMLNEKLFETEVLFCESFSTMSKAFKENFREICSEIAALQETGSLGEIAYIEYTLLRSNIINKNYAVEIRVYGKEWFMCKNQRVAGQLDISFLFQKLDRLWVDLLMMRKQYIGKVSSLDVSEFIMDTVPQFYAYVISLCRFSILDCVKQNYFKVIKKMPQFSINVGEYMAQTTPIYKENFNKDRKSFLKWLSEDFSYEYCFEDFSGLDLSNENFIDIDFRYSDLRNTTLTNTNFMYANLTGARFCGAELENAHFSYSILHETDFCNANLRNAKFCYSKAYEGLLDKEVWKRVGFFKVSFRKANLQNADFTGANLIGADFTEAVLDGAKFDLIRQNELDLSPEQMKVVVLK